MAEVQTPADCDPALGAHSLGGAIAVDALAECGADLRRTTLHTWVAMMGLLSHQEVLVEREVAKIYATPVQINNWVDIVFWPGLAGQQTGAAPHS